MGMMGEMAPETESMLERQRREQESRSMAAAGTGAKETGPRRRLGMSGVGTIEETAAGRKSSLVPGREHGGRGGGAEAETGTAAAAGAIPQRLEYDETMMPLPEVASYLEPPPELAPAAAEAVYEPNEMQANILSYVREKKADAETPILQAFIRDRAVGAKRTFAARAFANTLGTISLH